MSYEFKPLGEVEQVQSFPDDATVLIEDDGKIKRCKLSEVPSVEEFPDGATVLIEDSGVLKKCKADGLGGGNIFLGDVRQYIEVFYPDGDEAEYLLVLDDSLFDKCAEAIKNGHVVTVLEHGGEPTEHWVVRTFDCLINQFGMRMMSMSYGELSIYDDENVFLADVFEACALPRSVFDEVMNNV